MTPEQIHQLYKEKIEIKGIHKVLEVDKDTIANYRRRIDTMSLGLKMELLLKMGEIFIVENTAEQKEAYKSWLTYTEKRPDNPKPFIHFLLNEIKDEAHHDSDSNNGDFKNAFTLSIDNSIKAQKALEKMKEMLASGDLDSDNKDTFVHRITIEGNKITKSEFVPKEECKAYIDLLGKAGEKANGSFEVHRDGGSSIEDFKNKYP